jgi:small subunit ribosomal protein S8
MSVLLQHLVSSLKNAYSAHKKSFVFNGYSKMLVSVLELLQKLGFLSGHELVKDGNKLSLLVKLRYTNKQPAVLEISTVSKPSRHFYYSTDNIPYFKDSLGYYILTTSKGLMSDKKARRLGVGGKVLLKVF